jgi:hypothetical protein
MRRQATASPGRSWYKLHSASAAALPKPYNVSGRSRTSVGTSSTRGVKPTAWLLLA